MIFPISPPVPLTEQIIEGLEKTFAVDLLPILEPETLTERQKIVRFRDALLGGVYNRAEAENLSDFFLLPQDLRSARREITWKRRAAARSASQR